MKESHLKIAVTILSVFLLLIVIAGVVYYQQQTELEDEKILYFDSEWIFPEYEKLISESDLIVVAKVTDEKSIWEYGKPKEKPLFEFHLRNPWRDKELQNDAVILENMISTIYSFEPVTVLKGNTSEFKGRLIGGTLDGYSYISNGSYYTSFEDGDIVLLFLGQPIPEIYDIYEGSYSLGDIYIFVDNGDGTFSNYHYGTVTIDQVRKDISNINMFEGQ
ncbi:hypothetical protein MmiHf6_14400 [Methanimicrococcus hongohii]|uniref:Uncharacterized protein n=2 Tax=Methanimicrococcus hongohii TaxID=3028295 RepID=A0AA96ZUA8_9EURY|nr:hypothetical protein MmiHf6_14400 [Methanimicrococcus sp. Hf6]